MDLYTNHTQMITVRRNRRTAHNQMCYDIGMSFDDGRDCSMNQVHPFFIRKKQEAGIDLNPVQQQAVLHTEGPLLLLASPG